MSNSGFETLAVFRRHTRGSETDYNFSQISESGFEVENTESDSDTLSDSAEEQQPAHDDEYMEAESVHSTDVAMVPQPGGIHPEPWSVPELQTFTEAVLSHPIFLESLKADEILHLKHVCKSWATWFSSSTDIIAKVRRQDENSDWYFPVLYRLATPAHLFSWTWSGIWHGSAEHLLGTQPRPLPSLDCVPRTWRKWSHPETVAIAGGLLLIRFVRDIVNVPVRTYRCVREYWEPKGFKFRYCKYHCEGYNWYMGCPRCVTLDNRHWDPLMVVNPLTKAVRFLPAPDCFKLADWDVWSYRNIQVLMRVDDDANSYEVILLYNEMLFVYSSTSDRWKCLEFHQPGPWQGNWRPQDDKWAYNCASAWVGRRLFVANIRYPDDADYFRNPLTAGVLQVFEIDVEAGAWKRHNNFLLHKFTDWIRIPIIDVTGNEDFEDLIAPRNLELVECIGHIYAVIPARLDEFLHPLEDDTGYRPFRWSNWSNYSPRDPKCMPLQFYILQLQGDSLLNGVLRIELEPSASGWDYKSRRQNLFDKTKPENAPASGRNFFSCVGKGSVIWVSCEDYLLQYDVVSGQTRTQVIPVNWVEETMRFAYRSSFHVKP